MTDESRETLSDDEILTSLDDEETPRAVADTDQDDLDTDTDDSDADADADDPS